MLVNFMTTDRFEYSEDDPEYVKEFLEGSGMEVYGFALAEQYWGRQFNDVITEIYSSEGRSQNVLILAAQVNGVIMMNPQDHVIEPEQVVFAISPSPYELKPLQLQKSGKKNQDFDWKLKLVQNRADNHVDLSPQEVVELDLEQERQVRGHVEPPKNTSYWVTRALTSKTTSLNHRLEEFLDAIEENESMESKMRAEEEEARRVVQIGGHVLLGILDTGPDVWHQVSAFMRPLRAEYLPETVPIVVLTELPPPKDMLEFREVAFLVGHPTRMHDLLKAGLDKARCVVFMAGGGASEDSTRLTDASAIIACMALEDVIEKPGLQALGSDEPRRSREQTHTIVEFSNFQSVSLLARPSLPNGNGSCARTKDGVEDSTLLGSRTADLFIHGPGAFGAGLDSRGGDKEFCTNPRFTSGQIFTPAQLGALFAMGYWTPGIMEFMGALTAPTRQKQTSMLWQADVPARFVGKCYVDLFKHCMQQCGIQMILEGLAVNPDEAKGLSSVIPLGLYRPAGHLRSPMPYVFTNPPPDTTLVDGDKVYVLANALWGRLLHESIQTRRKQGRQLSAMEETQLMNTISNLSSFFSGLNTDTYSKRIDLLRTCGPQLPAWPYNMMQVETTPHHISAHV